MTETKIVLGLGFGDEGKGRVVSYLSSLGSPNKLIVRFNGGHQAGHTVQYKEKRHVFSTFGSGTLQNIPTYISKFCTVYPIAFMNEWNVLASLGVTPRVYIDPMCPITTPYDVEVNKQSASLNNHGSCGVGFGATIERSERYYNLYAQDLLFPNIMKAKLQNIQDHYYRDIGIIRREEKWANFIESVELMLNRAMIQRTTMLFYDDIIFEGAQGILLDMDFGFFPHVTRSNTTCKNAMELIREFSLPQPETYYVIRSYQTRHGKGFMTNEKKTPLLVNNEKETNGLNDWQGEFRLGMLDVDLVKYALKCDSHFQNTRDKYLFLTCWDQTGISFPGTSQDKVMDFDPYSLLNKLREETFLLTLFTSEGPETNQVIKG